MLTRIRRHPLVQTLLSLRGNPRACVYTEPLWGLPYQLFLPFVSVYMYSLGLDDVQIGSVLSAGLAAQIICAAFGGAITDKFGRRPTAFYTDFLSWSLPCLLWAFAQNYWMFLAAAILNGMNQATAVAWNCLLVEDADHEQLTDIFTWIQIAGMIAVFFAPVAGILVAKFSLVPVVRGLYLFAFVFMTAKFVSLWYWSAETSHGKTRMAETAGVSIFAMTAGLGGVCKAVLRSPEILITLAIMVGLNITTNISSTFSPLLITNDLGVPQQYLAYFPILRSAIILILFFSAQGIFRALGVKACMILGLAFSVLSLLCLALGGLVLAYVILEALAYGTLMPQRDALVARRIPPDERARIFSVLTAIMLAGTMPFGYFAGLLSHIDRRLPFVLNVVIFVMLALMIGLSQRVFAREQDGLAERAA